MLSIPSNFEKDETTLSRSLFRVEAQLEEDWTEPGFGTLAYMDFKTSHS